MQETGGLDPSLLSGKDKKSTAKKRKSNAAKSGNSKRSKTTGSGRGNATKSKTKGRKKNTTTKRNGGRKRAMRPQKLLRRVASVQVHQKIMVILWELMQSTWTYPFFLQQDSLFHHQCLTDKLQEVSSHSTQLLHFEEMEIHLCSLHGAIISKPQAT